VKAAIRVYYPLAGPRALWALAQHKIFRNYPAIATKIAGIPGRIYLRVHTTDLFVLRQVLLEREYQLPIRINPSVIVDAGANVGYTSVFFANQYPKAKTILAIDQIYRTIKFL
jgi:hypothetical protein